MVTRREWFKRGGKVVIGGAVAGAAVKPARAAAEPPKVTTGPAREFKFCGVLVPDPDAKQGALWVEALLRVDADGNTSLVPTIQDRETGEFRPVEPWALPPDITAVELFEMMWAARRKDGEN